MPRLADQDLHGLMRGERLLAGLSDMASFKRHPTGTRMGTSVRQLLQSPEDAGMYVPQPFVADHRNILATYHGIGPKAARVRSPSSPR